MTARLAREPLWHHWREGFVVFALLGLIAFCLALDRRSRLTGPTTTIAARIVSFGVEERGSSDDFPAGLLVYVKLANGDRQTVRADAAQAARCRAGQSVNLLSGTTWAGFTRLEMPPHACG